MLKQVYYIQFGIIHGFRHGEGEEELGNRDLVSIPWMGDKPDTFHEYRTSLGPTALSRQKVVGIISFFILNV